MSSVLTPAGDSVALLASGGQSQRLTVEHRLDNAEEVERVLEAGGRVVSFKPGAIPRVMGNSSQTRFKGSMVTRCDKQYSLIVLDTLLTVLAASKFMSPEAVHICIARQAYAQVCCLPFNYAWL